MLRRTCLRSPNNFMFSKRSVHHSTYAVVGAGTGGMNICAQLLSNDMCSPSSITVFDPSSTHYYQPGFTMAAGGLLGNTDDDIVRKEGGLLHRPTKQVFNSDINIIPEMVTEYNPDQNSLSTASGTKFTYDYLIVSSGIELRYDLVEGLSEALDDPEHPCGSMYRLDYAKKINRLRAKFNGGTVVATQPAMPIKCGGAPQKWLYLAEHSFRARNIRRDCDVKFFTQIPVMFGVPKYNATLVELVKEKDIDARYQHELVKVDKDTRTCWFKKADGELVEQSYDLLHAVPPQRANKFTAAAPFSDATGFVDVDKHTLQSKKYENVFAVGDASNCPCPKTAAAVFHQTPTLINNLKKLRIKDPLVPSFNGYTSCPIFVGDNKLLLCEFLYDAIPHETFGWMDQSRPNRFFYDLKKTVFPKVYWYLAPKGKWFGTHTIFEPTIEDKAQPQAKSY